MEKQQKYDSNGVDINEAPSGFYATLKIYKGKNICEECDARQLCIKNENDWCKKNRCMGYPCIYNNSEIVERRDGKSVIFKKIND